MSRTRAAVAVVVLALVAVAAWATARPEAPQAQERPVVAQTAQKPKPVVAELPCALPAYPTASCTGVPQGWRPKKVHDGVLTITTPGAVIEDYQVNGRIEVRAEDVTIRRTRVIDTIVRTSLGSIDNFPESRVYKGLVVEDTEVIAPPGQESSLVEPWSIGVASYTCTRCKIINRNEGFRIGARDYPGGDGPVVIEDSYLQLSTPPGKCPGAGSTADWHGDGIQGFGGAFATIRHNTIDQRKDPCPTAPIFIPEGDNAKDGATNQGNIGGDVIDNVVAGGGFSLRLLAPSFPEVTGNKVVADTWSYQPLDVDCVSIGVWRDNAVVEFDFEKGTIRRQVRPLNDCS